MAYLLGIDIGTSGTKSLLCDLKGKVIATAMAEHDIASPHPGWSEQDPENWWRAVCESVKKVLGKGKVKGSQVKAIGLSGQMHGSVFLDDAAPDQAVALRPALLWNDQRTIAECAEIEKAAGGRAKLIDMVGNPAVTGFTLPKILWVRKHEPEVFDRTRHILLPKDFIRYKMTGQYATEVGDASGTLLLNVRKRAWHTGLMRLLKLDPALFPKCHESHVVTGKLTRWAADAMGLAADTPVAGGSGDQPAGAVGNGIVSRGIVSASLGTSGVIFAHADKPIYDPKGRVHTMCHAVEGKWCVFGCMLSAGGSLQWVKNHLGGIEIQKAAERGVDPYVLIDEMATDAPRGSEGLLFLPYLTGERCPYSDPLARGGWIGLTARHNRAALYRSVMEGVTYGMNDALKVITGMGIAAEKVRVSSGGARSAFWRQLQADIYGIPTAVINTQEGPAYGVAILAGVGTGVWKSVPEACNAVISEVEQLPPNPDAARYYKKAHAQYRRMYPLLKETFEKLAKL